MKNKTVEPSRQRAVATLKKKHGKDYFSKLAKKKHQKAAKAKKSAK